MTTADFISAAAIDGSVTDVTIRCKSEQEVRDRYEQMRHLAIIEPKAPHWYTGQYSRWFVVDIHADGCLITISTAHEPIAREVAA